MTARTGIMQKKTAIIIAGATAVGKTDIAISIARHLGSEIISADARQCYRELNIGVARPTPEELSAVPHHFIASHAIFEPVNAAIFERYALHKAREILQEKDQVIICGGTGLYIRAFCEGLDEMPEVPQEYRDEVAVLLATGGIASLREAIIREDPGYAVNGEMDNPARLMRALSFMRATGRSIRDFQCNAAEVRPFHIVKILVDRPRTELYERINLRVTHMMDQGLWQEAESLFDHRGLKALQTVGYSEIFDCISGHGDKEQAADLIRQHTRNYAKRQQTWFKKETGMKSFHPGQFDEILSYLDREA
jgi:tRNA dimethylallyltransferase